MAAAKYASTIVLVRILLLALDDFSTSKSISALTGGYEGRSSLFTNSVSKASHAPRKAQGLLGPRGPIARIDRAPYKAYHSRRMIDGTFDEQLHYFSPPVS